MLAKKLYPDCIEKMGDEEYFISPYSYTPILQEFGEIIIRVDNEDCVDNEDYHGDSRVFYKKESRYGYLQFGWGSCSGCDALQACDSYEEIDTLIQELQQSIKWFDSIEETASFFKSHDWEGDYSWGDGKQKEFVEKVIKYLERKPNSED